MAKGEFEVGRQPVVAGQQDTEHALGVAETQQLMGQRTTQAGHVEEDRGIAAEDRATDLAEQEEIAALVEQYQQAPRGSAAQAAILDSLDVLNRRRPPRDPIADARAIQGIRDQDTRLPVDVQQMLARTAGAPGMTRENMQRAVQAGMSNILAQYPQVDPQDVITTALSYFDRPQQQSGLEAIAAMDEAPGAGMMSDDQLQGFMFGQSTPQGGPAGQGGQVVTLITPDGEPIDVPLADLERMLAAGATFPGVAGAEVPAGPAPNPRGTTRAPGPAPTGPVAGRGARTAALPSQAPVFSPSRGNNPRGPSAR
jgi:hypothetical protein